MRKFLVLNFDGTDGATSWTEETGISVLDDTPAYCELDTLKKKFGASSLLLLPGATNTIFYQYNSYLAITGDFTYHGWIRVTDIANWISTGGNNFYPIMMTTSGGSPLVYIKLTAVGSQISVTANVYGVELSDDTTPVYLANGIIGYDILSEDTDHHLAIIGTGKDILFAVDGVVLNTWTADIDTTMSGINEIAVGGYTVAGTDIRLDAWELTDYAQWTTDFTPPSSAPDGTPLVIPILSLEMYPPFNITAEIPMLSAGIYGAFNIAADIPTLSLEIFGPSGISAEIPMLSLLATGSRSESFDMTLPMLGMEIYGPSGVDVELPVLSLDIDGKTDKLANIKAAIPMLSMVSASGAMVVSELPSISLVVGSTIGVLADISALIPPLSMQMTDSGNNVGDMAFSIPVLHMASSIMGGQIVGMKGVLPSLNLILNANTGQVGDIELSLPVLQFKIVTALDDVSLVASIPSLTMYSEVILSNTTTGATIGSMVGSAVLRYVRGLVR